MAKHLIFYDGQCGLCDHAVQFVLKLDKRELFCFAPLQGITARELLKDLPPNIQKADSLILIENFQTPDRKIFIFGQGVLRICWLLGGIWKIPGTLSWLPASLYDWIYRLVAKNRYRLFGIDHCVLPTARNRHRFLN